MSNVPVSSDSGSSQEISTNIRRADSNVSLSSGSVCECKHHEEDDENQQVDENLEKMCDAARTLLGCVGEDVNREGIVKTPMRMSKALRFFTKGYTEDLQTIVNDAIFSENHHEMVLVKNIDFFSMCEHHMVPFMGKVHIAYIPNGQVIGLSKLGRITELFTRRLQVQERITTQIADAVDEVLKPLGVAVVIESQHLCMVMRGVEKVSASTTTRAMRGIFSTDTDTRNEFYSQIKG